MFDFVIVASGPSVTSSILLDDGSPTNVVSFYTDEDRTRIVARESVEMDEPFRNTLTIYNHDAIGLRSRQEDRVVDY